eukprot:CAMPEP_0118695142 /NCGR_PEP_ID=MMETSP0800-20121206/12999_1 /TAXON_ID=210618 ORGANISM="Striatella unipunctata, Strain CCMP2910" /NCGR_SAMPLE_ID=MMETSP0800 /ASSEMBLY_ACC=CAM_ASM_000638 /LENGTH=282 /DNA_ID=CAMNT_0006593855 /DNA_START=262 /DNA_END=1110 /DNA_ORIENTATION=+
MRTPSCSSILLIFILLLLSGCIAAMAKENTNNDNCYCGPKSLAFQLNFKWTLETNSSTPCTDWVRDHDDGEQGIIPIGRNVEACKEINRDLFDNTQYLSPFVKSYLIRETVLDTTEAMFPRTVDTVGENLLDGDMISWSSAATATLLPSRFEVYVKLCANGLSLNRSGASPEVCETFVLMIEWTKECQRKVPLFSGSSLGIIAVHSSETSEFCGFTAAPSLVASATNVPTVAPIRNPTSLLTTSPTVSTSAPPTLSTTRAPTTPRNQPKSCPKICKRIHKTL